MIYGYTATERVPYLWYIPIIRLLVFTDNRKIDPERAAFPLDRNETENSVHFLDQALSYTRKLTER